MKAINLTGQRFGRLIAMQLSGKQHMRAMWDCVCDCGVHCQVRSDHLQSGATKSCGCFNRAEIKRRQTIHGMTRTPEHKSWVKMRERCSNPKDISYKYYGARGITVCERWQNSFPNFLADMSCKPTPRHSIDRINQNGNYEPSNCRWADTVTQQNNRRTNVTLTVGEVTKTVTQWGREAGHSRGLLCNRLRRGWSVERAISTPASDYRGKS